MLLRSSFSASPMKLLRCWGLYRARFAYGALVTCGLPFSRTKLCGRSAPLQVAAAADAGKRGVIVNAKVNATDEAAVSTTPARRSIDRKIMFPDFS